jgi:hypothetical protein
MDRYDSRVADTATADKHKLDRYMSQIISPSAAFICEIRVVPPAPRYPSGAYEVERPDALWRRYTSHSEIVRRKIEPDSVSSIGPHAIMVLQRPDSKHELVSHSFIF